MVLMTKYSSPFTPQRESHLERVYVRTAVKGAPR